MNDVPDELEVFPDPEANDDPPERRTRDALIRAMPRDVAVRLGLRILVPGRDGIPSLANTHDVGGIAPPPEGVIRPAFRQQNPAIDPTEPQGGEGGATGEDHGWANCNMSAAALVWAYHKNRADGPWGGDFRHNQYDLSGGTDLYDAQTAWENYGGQHLSIRSGDGWKELKRLRNQEGRAILAHGTGACPGNDSFTGAHACVIGLENHEKSGRWLFGDPLASDWQYVEPADIRAWMERLSPSLSFAVSKELHPPE